MLSAPSELPAQAYRPASGAAARRGGPRAHRPWGHEGVAVSCGDKPRGRLSAPRVPAGAHGAGITGPSLPGLFDRRRASKRESPLLSTHQGPSVRSGLANATITPHPAWLTRSGIWT